MATLRFKPDLLMQVGTTHEYRVLFMFFSRMDEQNLVVADLAELARELQIKPAKVSSAIERLIASKFLAKGPTETSYRVSRKVAWLETPENWEKAEKDYLLEERMKAANITGVIESATPPEEIPK